MRVIQIFLIFFRNNFALFTDILIERVRVGKGLKLGM